MIRIALLAALVAVALGDGYQAGLKVTHAGAVAPYNNAARQQAVNSVAHNIGRGTGTAYYDGVAGAGRVHLVNHGQHGYGYGHGGYHGGYGGYGHHDGHYGGGYGAHHGGYGYGSPGNYRGFNHGYGHGRGHGYGYGF